MTEIKAKKVIFKNRDGEYLIPYVGDTAIENRITNCLLEVPQRIKLELVDGTPTLKAGSVVIVPNGFEEDGVTPKFDEVLIENDISLTFAWGSSNAKMFLFYYNGILNRMEDIRTVSGNTNSYTGAYSHFWYDTANNLVKNVNSDGSFSSNIISLPLCLYTSLGKDSDGNDSTKAVSIDQVFNGMGYIGSTIWVDKGVKGLIPNGRNEDGSLRNIEFTTSKVMTKTDVGTNTCKIMLRADSFNNYINVYYDEEKNVNWNTTQPFINYCIAGTFTRTSGVISNFQPKQPFRALDWNDYNELLNNHKSEISGWGMPSNKFTDLTLGASGSTYTAPANGWFASRMIAGSSNQYNQLFCSATGINVVYNAVQSKNEINIVIPVKKGDVVKHNYNASGSTKTIVFIYAEGEV